MKNRFQYIMIGAGLTLLVILGVFVLLLPRAQASEASLNAAGSVETYVQPAYTNNYAVADPNSQVEQNQKASGETATTTTSTITTETVAEESIASLGTIDNPQTNMDIILYTVSGLARKQEEALMGKPGWLHVKWQMILPEGQKGTGYHSAATDEVIPMERLVPESPVFDSWYHVDETGLYREALSLVTSTDGTIYQRSVLVDGTWINLTLKTLDTHPNQYETPTALAIAAPPASEVFQALEESQTWSGVSMQAYLENGQYIVIKEQRHDPIEDAFSMPEPVIGSKETYIFDQVTGQLLFSEMQSLLQSETWLSVGEKSYLTIEFLPELPEGISQLFNDSMTIAGEEK